VVKNFINNRISIVKSLLIKKNKLIAKPLKGSS
jgi:hypothetical protein